MWLYREKKVVKINFPAFQSKAKVPVSKLQIAIHSAITFVMIFKDFQPYVKHLCNESLGFE